MNRILKLALQGLGALLPLGLTLYFIYWLFAAAESVSRSLLLWLLPPELYFTGLGVLATFGILILAGLLVNAYGIRYLVQWGDNLMARIPLVKSIYGAIQDIMRVFSLNERKNLHTVVSLDMGNDMQLIGFVTGELSGQSLFGDGKVGVYLPMSYQIGGFTLYVDRHRLKVLNIGVEEAMRIALTGGVQGRREDPPL